jgi:RluA family pseudouridine synthase
MRLFPKDRDLSRGTDEVELRVRASDFQARADEFEIRLDVFLARYLSWRSRSSVQNLIRDGHIAVDASTPEHPRGSGTFLPERRPGRRLHHGSRVLIVIPEHLRLAATVETSEELVVLYEDESVIAVDKPPMLAVHPSGRHLTDTLIQRVHAAYRSEELHRDARPRLCHRLDRETSGIVLVGKDPEAHQHLMRQFERRRVEKEYLAIVRGRPERDTGVVDLPLGPARASAIRLKMAVVADGLESRTEWNVVRRHAGCTLVACRPHTGRQHQIRVHLDAIGHPLVGDKLYGLDEGLFQRAADGELSAEDLERLELPRQALHNHRLAFTSPRSGARVCVESPLAPDLERFLAERPLP